MSKYTAEQVRAHLCFNDSVITDTGRDMLREYAAHLAAQAKWPSEEDVNLAASEISETGFGVHLHELPIVSPYPNPDQTKMHVYARAAIESYAYRHAPTKD